jgi:hypothetical protein
MNFIGFLYVLTVDSDYSIRYNHIGSIIALHLQGW